MDNLRACPRCGSVVTIGSSCKCEDESVAQMMSIQDRRKQPRRPRRRSARPHNRQGYPDSDRKTANKVMIGGLLLLLAVVAVCSWRVNSGSENRSAQTEANNIAAYQRMNIDLGDCYRWLVQFDDQKQALIAQGHGRSSAEAVAIAETKRNYTYAEYRAILQRCGVLWGEATEEEKLRAMR